MTVGTNIGEDGADLGLEEVFSSGGSICGSACSGSFGFRLRGLVPWCAHLDPGNQVGNLLFVELPVQRHFQVAGLPNGLDQQALLRVSRNNGGSPAAAG